MQKLTYCKAILAMDETNVHRIYHDNHYGFPISDDNELFERLVLEINQAGLSWDTILKKEVNFKKAYKNFNVNKVANFQTADFNRLMNNAGIIRNRLKINAAIHNANMILNLQKEFGSFKKWIDFHHPKTKDEWVKIFKKTFKFTGGEIVNEFLMSTGYLPGAHEKDCIIYQKTLNAGATFLK
ncbi:MAG: DNA-3-methyladenine glycosylase I [Ginsengibacter sp.]